MAIILSPYETDTLAQRAAARHMTGERPEDDHSNCEEILREIIRMSVIYFNVNPMGTPLLVEEEAATSFEVGCTCSSAKRGRSTLPGSAMDARERRDPSEADIE